MFWVRGHGRPLLLSLFALGFVACSRADDAGASSKRGGADEARLLAAPAFQRVKALVDDLEKRATKLPKNAQVRADLGRAYLKGGLRVRALAQLEKAIELDPDQFEARLVLVDLALASGDVATARRLVDDGLQRKRSAGMLVADAKTRLCADPTGAREEAHGLLAEALALKPTHIDANYEFGVLQLERGEAADAAQRFERVVAAVPNHLGAHFNLARAYAKLGRAADAEREGATHKRLGRLDDLGMLERWDSIDASLALADVLIDGGDHDGALAELATALAHHPGDVGLLLKTATCWSHTGDAARARDAFEDMSERYPDDARVMSAHARFLAAGPADAREPKRAVSLAQNAVQKTAGKDVDALDALAEAYAASDDFNHAVTAIREAEKLAPTQPERKRRRDEIERRAGISK